jgi:hypothetical protein
MSETDGHRRADESKDASTSPFGLPPLSSGYPLDDEEKRTIDRLLRDHEAEERRERSKEASSA